MFFWNSHAFSMIQQMLAILRKEKQNGKNRVSWLQTKLQSYRNQGSIVLTLKQTHKSVKQERKPRNKPTHLWSINLWQKRQEYTTEEKTVSSISGARKTGELHWKEWKQNIYHMQKIHSKWTKDLNVRLDSIKTLRGKHRQNIVWHKSQQDLSGLTS